MLPGPVFYWELLTTSRRLRYYLARSAFGLILLFVLWNTFDNTLGWASRRGQPVSISALSNFATSCFTGILFALGAAVLILVPALAAGVIADEKQRKTLNYLLASSLTSAEIVLGKAAARFLHLTVILALSLPILSLLTLLGGITPSSVLGAILASATTGFFLTGFAVLVSTYMRKVRDAVVAVYAFEAFWLLAPFLIDQMAMLMRVQYQVLEWISLLLRPLYFTSPLWLLRSSIIRGGASQVVDSLVLMCSSQVVAGFLFLGIAVLRLRPVYCRQMGGERRRVARVLTLNLLPKRWRRPRQPCGDQAMYWKELWMSRAPGASKWITQVGILFGLGLLAYSMSEVTYKAVQEFLSYGYRADGRTFNRDNFQTSLRVSSAVIYTIWGLSLAIAASLTITAEREEDTWISLLGTPLEAREILFPKMLGCLWRTRFLPALMIGGWVFGVLVGAVHPFGFLAATAELAIFTSFIVALGVAISLRIKTSLRAMLITLSILFFTNFGYLMCLVPLFNGNTLATVGCTPILLGVSLFSSSELQRLPYAPNNMFYNNYFEQFLSALLGSLFYAALAAMLTRHALRSFDSLAGRPGKPGVSLPDQAI